MSAEANKALVRRWFAAMDAGDLQIINELLPDDYVDHNPPLPGLPEGREGLRQTVMVLRSAFPDAVHTIEDQMAEGDKVMTRVSVSATFTGPCLGFQPTGKVVTVSGIAVHRIADGRLVEHWAHLDMVGFMEQIGDVSTPQPAR
jgi:steroid delta-isomerase-like uncharacterized protein